MSPLRALTTTGNAVVAALTLIAVLCFVMAVLTMCSAKTEARKARKMGQLTVTGTTADAARDTALKAATILGIAPF